MSLKQKQLERLLQSAFPEVPDLFNTVQIDIVCLENAKSFWSEVYLATIVDSRENAKEKLPSDVFIKVPKISENVQRSEQTSSDLLDVMKFYSKKENIFYNTFKNMEIPYFPIPKVYATEDITDEATGGIVAENFSREHYHAIDYMPGFDDAQAMRMMEALAGFHSFTQQMEDKSVLGIFVEGAMGREIYSPPMQQMTYQEALLLEKYQPDIFGNERIKNIEWSFDYELKTKAYKKATTEFPNVLVHSDLNVTNLLWKKNEENSAELSAVIDFQVIHQGSIAHDIIRVLTLGLSKEHRVAHSERYLKHYHATVTKRFNGNPPYTFEQLMEQYDIIYPFASNFTLFGLSMYYKLFSDGTFGTDENREANLKELISRAAGIVEDIEKLKGKHVE